LNAATGTFGGELTAATGTFSGALSAATGTFTGSLSAATGTFSGTLDASSISTGTLDVARLANIGSAQIADGAIINAKIGNAQITTAKIDDAQVDTLQIQGQAVTFPRGAQASNSVGVSTAGSNVLGIYITATGAPLIIIGSANFYDPQSDRSFRGYVSLYRDGTRLFGPIGVATSFWSGTDFEGKPKYTLFEGGSIQVYLPTGVTGTYYLQCSGDGSPNVEDRSLTIVEAKR
jgi:hypothetical protein